MADYVGAIGKLLAGTTMAPPGLVAQIGPPLKHDPALQTSLQSALTALEGELPGMIAAHPTLPQNLKPWAFAVVDLTDGITGYGPASPAYAGFNDTVTKSVVSMAKLLPLYVAHVLRSTARELATTTNTTSVTVLGPLVRKHLQRVGGADDTFPLIEDMFDFVDGTVEFKTGGTRWTGSNPIDDDALEVIEAEDQTDTSLRRQAVTGTMPDSLSAASRRTILTGQLAAVAFREQLRLMTRWSNDVSASIVTQAIGFPLLWQVASRSGLFRSKGWEVFTGSRKGKLADPGGMFLGRDFANNSWDKRPPQAPVRSDNNPNQAGTARSVAQLMTALAHTLIDDEARLSMRELLRKDPAFVGPGGKGEPSYIGEGMAKPPASWAPDQQALSLDGPVPGGITGLALRSGELAVSKIGDWTSTEITVASNALLVRCIRPGAAGQAPITAVLVGMCTLKGIDSDPLRDLLTSFGTRMAAALDLRHP